MCITLRNSEVKEGTITKSKEIPMRIGFEWLKQMPIFCHVIASLFPTA